MSPAPACRIVLLAPHTTPEQVIVALRKRVFACFSSPFDASEIADMLARAARGGHWKDGIEVLSATPGLDLTCGSTAGSSARSDWSTS